MQRKHGVAGRCQKEFSHRAAFLLSVLAFWGCAPQKQPLSASQFRFSFQGETYRLRSISSLDKTKSYNEVIGATFVVADLDQDRILDCVLLGEVRLEEAQQIYDHGLALAANESKLRMRMPGVVRYTHTNDGILLEITSFRPAQASPFNQFKIVDKRPVVCPEIVVVLDHDADGTLDKVLKGSVTLVEAQARYSEALTAGLQKGELQKSNGMILVKER